jgi:hypothetical protein
LPNAGRPELSGGCRIAIENAIKDGIGGLGSIVAILGVAGGVPVVVVTWCVFNGEPDFTWPESAIE